MHVTVSDIGGQHSVLSVSQIDSVLQRRIDSDANAFSISRKGENYPVLSLLVKGDLATLNFLVQEDDPGYIPTGNALNLSSTGNTVFHTSHNRADDLEVSNDAVVSWSVALGAAKEFALSKRMPESIEWMKL